MRFDPLVREVYDGDLAALVEAVVGLALLFCVDAGLGPWLLPFQPRWRVVVSHGVGARRSASQRVGRVARGGKEAVAVGLSARGRCRACGASSRLRLGLGIDSELVASEV